jgi:hypothetical protein
MTFNRTSFLVITLATLASGAHLWPVPPEQLEMLTRSFVVPWLGMAVLAGLLVQLILTGRRGDTPGLITIGFILSVLGRVAVDGLTGAGVHSLWPVEVALGGGIGFGGGWFGMMAGTIIDRYRQRRTWR